MSEQITETLTEAIRRLDRKVTDLENIKGTKGFKLPWTGKVSKRRVKKGYATIMYARINGSVRFLRAPIIEGMVHLEDQPHPVEPHHILNHKNKPLIVITEWSTDPVCLKDHFDDTARLKMRTTGIKTLKNYMESNQIVAKKKVNMMVVLIILAVVLGGGYYLLKNGGIG